MGKTKKVIVALFVALLMVFCVAGCSADTNELQSKIDELETRIEETNERLAEMEEHIQQLEKKLAEKEEKPVTLKNIEAVVETTLYSRVDNCKDFIVICNSLDEFKQECLRNGYDFFDENNQMSNYFNTAAGGKIRGYTDEYFENNSFIVCAFIKGSWAGQYLIDGVEVTSNKLTLCIKSPENYAADTIMNSVFLIAGLAKPSVLDITDLEYVLR